MSRHARLALFGVAAVGLAALMLWSISGLPKFGDYHGAYGRILNKVAPNERQTSNVVAAVTFDYRGFDTMGEELILFAAVMGVAMLLREPREEDAPVPRDPVRSDALRAFGVALAGAALLLGLWIVAHGYITPGGGFQGGVILAGAFLLVWLAGSYRAYRRLTPVPFVELGEGTGAGGYVVVGLVALLIGDAFLHNLLPYGVSGKLSSGGSIPLLNWAAGLEVSAAFVLLFNEFLTERAVLVDSGRRPR
jgi:multicomponent Na+:H+ antiporter subunit B